MPATHERAAINYDRLLRRNTTAVFSERDAVRRMQAIEEIYAADATLFEPDAVAKGHAAISAAVEGLLGMLPPDFAFAAAGPAVGHHGVARIEWRGSAPGGPVAVTGTDVARIADGRITELYGLLDPVPRP